MSDRTSPQDLRPRLIWPADGKEMVLIPAAGFLMGDDGAHWADQKPAHRVKVAAFYVDRYPVTNAEYARFVAASGHCPPKHMVRGQAPPGKKDHPVVNLSWDDALAYARWAGKRLPTEAEWEKAASWDPGARLKTRFPWGDEWDAARCNVGANGHAGDSRPPGDTSPVGAYSPHGDSASGLADLLGNVWEWCSSAHAPYPYQAGDGREDLSVERWRILRGAAWDSALERDVRCTFRQAFPSRFFLPSFGCRCVVSASALVEQEIS